MSDEKDILFTSGSSATAKTTIKKSRSYGSTSKSVASTTTAPKTQIHKVRPNDTLVSLAIKFETSVEELKRLNSLWSSDSLQLKATIKVPDTAAAAVASAASAAAASRRESKPPAEPVVSLEQFVSEGEQLSGPEAENRQPPPPPPPSAAACTGTRHHGKAASAVGGVPRSKTFQAVGSGGGGEQRDFSEMDSGEFLRKFDLQFMQLKSNIEKLENESSLSEEDSSAYSCLTRRSARYMSRQAFRSSSDHALEGVCPPDALANPELMVVRSQQMPEAEEAFFKL